MTFHEINAELKTIRDELSTDIPTTRRLELQAKQLFLEVEFKQDYVYRDDSICESCMNQDVCMLAERHPTRTVLECNYYE